VHTKYAYHQTLSHIVSVADTCVACVAQSSTEYPIESGYSIVFADILDPYALALLDCHTLAMLQPCAEPGAADQYSWRYLSPNMELHDTISEIATLLPSSSTEPLASSSSSKIAALAPMAITACCLYKDEIERPALIQAPTAEQLEEQADIKPALSASTNGIDDLDDNDLDEDENFYEDGDVFMHATETTGNAAATEQSDQTTRSSAHYCAIVRANGSLAVR
jgi:hypothetical protein